MKHIFLFLFFVLNLSKIYSGEFENSNTPSLKSGANNRSNSQNISISNGNGLNPNLINNQSIPITPNAGVGIHNGNDLTPENTYNDPVTTSVTVPATGNKPADGHAQNPVQGNNGNNHNDATHNPNTTTPPSNNTKPVNEKQLVESVLNTDKFKEVNMVFNDNKKLIEAVNIAISKLITTTEKDKLMQKFGIKSFKPILLCSLNYPAEFVSENKIPTDDALSHILTNSAVRVGTYNTDFGTFGNYTLDVPTGFFPEYLRKIWDLIGKFYNKTIKIIYVKGGESVFDQLDNKKIHSTDLYYFLAQSNKQVPVYNNFSTSCPTVATEHYLLTRTSSNINSLSNLNAAIFDNASKPGINPELSTVLFLTKINYEIFKSLLSPKGNFKVIETENNETEIINSITNKKAIGAITTSIIKLEDQTLTQYPLEILAAMGSIYKGYSSDSNNGHTGGSFDSFSNISYLVLLVSLYFCLIE